MLTQQDLQQIAAKGIAEEQLQKQMDDFKRGFPFLRLDSAVTVGHGILAPTDAEREEYIRQWDAYKAGKHRVTKFVPASGAASRMFKNLFAFLDADYDAPQTSFEHEFFDHIHQFAFFSELDAACLKNEGKGIDDLLAAGGHKAVVANLLEERGLNYGQLPKGLLRFHRYEDGARTAMEEHLVEGARYASTNGEAHIHFTVSHEHLPLFKAEVEKRVGKYAEKYQVRYDISFSGRNRARTPWQPIPTTRSSATKTGRFCSDRVDTARSSRTSTTWRPTWSSSRTSTTWCPTD